MNKLLLSYDSRCLFAYELIFYSEWLVNVCFWFESMLDAFSSYENYIYPKFSTLLLIYVYVLVLKIKSLKDYMYNTFETLIV